MREEGAVWRGEKGIGEIFAMLVERIEGSVCSDHIHTYLRITSKRPVNKVVGRPKGKSAIILFDRLSEWRGETIRDRTLRA